MTTGLIIIPTSIIVRLMLYSSFDILSLGSLPAKKSCKSEITPGSVSSSSPMFGNIDPSISNSESCSSIQFST